MRLVRFTLLVALATFFTGVVAQDVSIVSPTPMYSVSGNTLNVTWATPSLTERYVLRGCRVIRNGVPLANLYQPGEYYSEPLPTSNVEFELQCEGTVKPIWLGQVSAKMTFVPSPTVSYWSKYDNTPAVAEDAPISVADGGFLSGGAWEFTGTIDNGFDYSPPSLGSGDYYVFDLKLDQPGDEFVAYINVVTNLGTPLELSITNRQQGAQYTTSDAVHYIDPTTAIGTVVKIAKNITSLIQTIPGRESETFANFAATEKTLWRMPTSARLDAIGRVASAVETPSYGGQSVPTAPSNVIVTGVTTSTVDLSWTASTDTDGNIDRYLIYRDGNYLDDSFTTSYTATGLTEDQQYTFEISAIDNDTNEGPKSLPVNGTPTAPPTGGDLLANLDAFGNLDIRGVKAFPGADGYGQDVTGGRGGQVLTVNTLADNCTASDGNITWREAITGCADGNTGGAPVTIVFAIGGKFESNESTILIGRSDVTVACQTAPTWPVFVETVHFFNADNVIVRHCINRNDGTPQQNSAGSDRGWNMTGNDAVGTSSRDMIFDHISVSWTQDSNWQVYQYNVETGAQNFTLSYSHLSRGDGSNETTPGENDSATGPVCLGNNYAGGAGTYIDGCSFLNNYSAHNNTRNGALWDARGEILNTVVYNWNDGSVQMYDVTGNGDTDGHVRNNIVKKGPINLTGTSTGTIYGVSGTNAAGSDNWFADIGVAPSAATSYGVSSGNAPRNTQSGTDTGDIKTLWSNVNNDYVKCIGASAWGQDDYDRQWIVDMFNGTGPDFDGLAVINRDYSQYVTVQRDGSYDTDGDGIADSWEDALIAAEAGLTSRTQITPTSDFDADGYTDLEEFINQEARCPHVTGGGGGGGITGNGMDNLTTYGTTDPEFPKAFPGAFGVGRYTRGGRTTGTQHIVVDTTNVGKNAGDGLTSLQEALETSGPKIISFSVGGEFIPDVDGEGFRRWNATAETTLLCSTAPDPGVVIAGDSYIIKYMAEYIERGCIHAAADTVASSESNRGISIAGRYTNNIMIDHAEIMWGGDENFLVYNFDQNPDAPVENVTLQDSAIVEGDVDSSHPQSLSYAAWAYHAQGPNCNTNSGGQIENSVECTFAYNFMAHATGRNPGCLGGWCEYVGNITYNGLDDHIQFRGTAHYPGESNLYWHNNLMKRGPNYSALTNLGEATQELARLDAGGNYEVGLGAAISTASLYTGFGYDYSETLNHVTPTVPLTLNGKDIKALAQDASYLACRGAFPHRSETVNRVIQEFQATGSFTTGWGTPAGSEAGGTIGIGANPVPDPDWYVWDSNSLYGAARLYPQYHNVTNQRAIEYAANNWTVDNNLTGDTDGDTIPDDWESANGMNPASAADALGDVDSDGYLNIEEYVSYLLRCPGGY